MAYSGLCGSGDGHCCWFKGDPCPYVKAIDNPPQKWECSLRSELGSWDAVYIDKRYIDEVKPLYVMIGQPDLLCHEYPNNGQKCSDCGEQG